jgi:hypothetical protein
MNLIVKPTIDDLSVIQRAIIEYLSNNDSYWYISNPYIPLHSRNITNITKANSCCVLAYNIQILIIIPKFILNYNIHTYYSRFIPEAVADASQILFRDAHDLLKLFSYEEYSRRGTPIAV